MAMNFQGFDVEQTKRASLHPTFPPSHPTDSAPVFTVSSQTNSYFVSASESRYRTAAVAVGAAQAATFVTPSTSSDITSSSLPSSKWRYARFLIPNLPHAPTSRDGRLLLRTADLSLTVALAHDDVGDFPLCQGHRLVSASLGGKKLTPKQAFTLVTLQLMLTGHSKIHASANWGLKAEKKEERFGNISIKNYHASNRPLRWHNQLQDTKLRTNHCLLQTQRQKKNITVISFIQ